MIPVALLVTKPLVISEWSCNLSLAHGVAYLSFLFAQYLVLEKENRQRILRSEELGIQNVFNGSIEIADIDITWIMLVTRYSVKNLQESDQEPKISVILLSSSLESFLFYFGRSFMWST